MLFRFFVFTLFENINLTLIPSDVFSNFKILLYSVFKVQEMLCKQFASLETHKPAAYFVTCIRTIKILFVSIDCKQACIACSSKILALLIAFVEMERFELLTPCLQGRCSPN